MPNYTSLPELNVSQVDNQQLTRATVSPDVAKLEYNEGKVSNFPTGAGDEPSSMADEFTLPNAVDLSANVAVDLPANVSNPAASADESALWILVSGGAAPPGWQNTKPENSVIPPKYYYGYSVLEEEIAKLLPNYRSHIANKKNGNKAINPANTALLVIMEKKGAVFMKSPIAGQFERASDIDIRMYVRNRFTCSNQKVKSDKAKKEKRDARLATLDDPTSTKKTKTNSSTVTTEHSSTVTTEQQKSASSSTTHHTSTTSAPPKKTSTTSAPPKKVKSSTKKDTVQKNLFSYYPKKE